MSDAAAICSSSSGSRDVSTQSTSTPGRAKPCGGRRQAERLPAEVVGGDQQRAHLPIVWKRTILAGIRGHDVAQPSRTTDAASAHDDDVLRPSARPLHALLHRDVGALQLLRDARAAHPLHDRRRRPPAAWASTRRPPASIYGLYTSWSTCSTLPGGWIADRLIGQRRAVLYGGILIACGHFSLAVPSLADVLPRPAPDRLGTGLLKPNISAIVGDLYAPKDARRDAGFSIFYMGINLGAFSAPLVCRAEPRAQRVNWHYGFAAAGVGMTLGADPVRRSAASTSATRD